MKRVIFPGTTASANLPYSPAIEVGGTLYISGQLPVDPATGVVAESIEDQTRQSLANLDAILQEAGYGRCDVVRCTVLLQSIGDIAAMNAIYTEFYSAPFPTRVCYQVAHLPLGVKVEIEAIAYK